MFRMGARMIRHPAACSGTPDQLRDLFKVADPFIVHGHRHACLYRINIVVRNSFIVLKICKIYSLMQADSFAYLWNNEAGRVCL